MTKIIKLILIILLWLSTTTVKAQNTSSLLKYIGKYETNGLVVPVAINNGSPVLIVPGAPFQEMIQQEGNKFKTEHLVMKHLVSKKRMVRWKA